MRAKVDNPFNRANLLTSRSNNYSSNYNNNYNNYTNNYISNPNPLASSQLRQQNYQISIWNFREDHSNSFEPRFQQRDRELNHFEKTIMLTETNSRRRNTTQISQTSRTLPENNPFHRKNLLISRNEVEQEIEKDLLRANYIPSSYTPVLNQSKRQSFRNSFDQQDQENLQLSKNTSLIMNLLGNIVQEGKPTEEVGSSKKDASSSDKFIVVRGRKYYQAKVER